MKLQDIFADMTVRFAAPPEEPEVECCRCTKVWPLKTATWEEHDPRAVGWWCKPCRIDIGMDVVGSKPNFVVMHTTAAGANGFYEDVKRRLEGKKIDAIILDEAINRG